MGHERKRFDLHDVVKYVMMRVEFIRVFCGIKCLSINALSNVMS
jgi:hypothetical protein